jgi:hypothetical protein
VIRKSGDPHPMYFMVACCSGRRLILGGVLVCSVCDGPALTQRNDGTIPYVRVATGIETLTIKPL